MLLNAAQLHLTLNHFPIVLAAVSLPFLFWAALKKSEFSRRVGLLLIVMAALLSIPAFLTGEPAEDLVKQAGASKTLIHDHEEAAEAGFIALLITGAIAIGSWFLYYRKHSKARMALVLCLVAALVSSALLARAAHLGGFIMHQEIRPN